ncbi:hypothetical protein BGW42_001667 [Actinomortierella wolfii]|nr:hypothetical protein BGW42_001667 [Actinomortierella wolfii]
MACPAGYTLEDLYRPPGSYISDNLQIGQRIISWGSLVTWSEKHMRARDLEMYRMQGDPLSDEALQALGVKRHEDAYEALMAYVQRPLEEQESDAPRRFLEEVMQVPDWVDWEQLRRGQQVFWKYVLFISIGLVHFSLTGLYNAPKFAKVMTSTGYLTGNNSNARVTETSQFIFDMNRSVDDLRPGSGYAWKSIVRVRLLHSQVRLRLIRLSKAHSKVYSVERHGVPINQEDMASTLFILSAAMWRTMESRLGVSMTLQEREDFLMVWRYMGFYMGVDPAWDPAKDVDKADAMYESIIMHVNDPTVAGGQKASKMLYNLMSVMPLPHGLHLAISEALLGADMWMLMGQKPAAWYNRLLRSLLFGSFYLDCITFSQWEWYCNKRAELVRAGLDWMIKTELGTRSNYTYHEEPKIEHVLGTDNSVFVRMTNIAKDVVTGQKTIERSSWWPSLAVLGVLSIGYIFFSLSGTRVALAL